jgi:hypothetical protein
MCKDKHNNRFNFWMPVEITDTGSLYYGLAYLEQINS